MSAARVAVALVPRPMVDTPATDAATAPVPACPRPQPVARTPGRVHNLGPAARVPVGGGRTYWVEGREIAVFRDRRRQVFAAQPWCPHHFGSLSEGSVGYAEVTCPLHGLRFDLRSGAARGHACGSITTYRVRVSRDGDLLVRLD
jgi:nitrite reductase (NADH) small subunit